jgi:predicted nicotinamide N-methyase
MGDKKWREFNIHDSDRDDSDEDDYTSGLHLFDQIQDEEMMNFSFLLERPALEFEKINITLKGYSDYTHSTGMAVWLGSEIMSYYLLHNSEKIRNKCVLELGAGLGLAGILSQKLNASKVVLTDGDISVVKDYLRYNATTNETDCMCPQLIWGNQGHAKDDEDNPLAQFRKEYGTFDVILACDIMYMPQSLEPFWQTVDALLNESGSMFYVMEASSQVAHEEVLHMAEKLDFGWISVNTSTFFSSDGVKEGRGENLKEKHAPVYLFSRKKDDET